MKKRRKTHRHRKSPSLGLPHPDYRRNYKEELLNAIMMVSTSIAFAALTLMMIALS